MRKILLIIIDGLSDRPIPQLGNKTPLEAAKTPNLDWLAKNGICGLIEPFRFPGDIPHSDTTHLAIFGYNPKIYYLGRGPYEAAGIGMKMKKGDIALRVNFGTVDENLRIIDRRAGRISQTQPLVNSLNGITIDKVKFLIKKSYGHRAGLILRSLKSEVKLSEKISDGDPSKVGLKIKKIVPLDKSRRSQYTANILNKFLEKAHQILKNHLLNKKREEQGFLPGNYLLVRGAGQFKKMPSFKNKWGLKACCIAGGALYKGIAKILGMDLINVKGATGLPNTNLKAKFLAVKKALKKPAPYRPAKSGTGAGYDFIFLHIKATDNLGEDGNFKGKRDFIEKIDKGLKPLLALKDVLIVVTADHSTCCLLKRHCAEPIPILIYSSQIDRVKELARLSFAKPARLRVAEGKSGGQKLGGFSEKACKKGKLGQIKQVLFMPKILKILAGKTCLK